MIQSFEQAVRLMPPSVERWIWFADLTGFGVRDLSPVRCFCTCMPAFKRVAGNPRESTARQL